MTPRWRSALAGMLRLALILLPFIVAFVVIGGLGATALWVASQGGYFTSSPLTVVTLILLGVVVNTVSKARFARPRPVTDGVELTEESQHALWATVRAVASSLDVAPPEILYLGLDPLPVALMTRTGGLGRRRRLMVLGVAPLCSLSLPQWRAALSQVLMMEQYGTSRERRLLRGQRWMTSTASVAPREKWVRWTRHVPTRAHAWLAFPTCRRRQFDADLKSAELTTPEDVRLALLKVPAAQLAWGHFWSLHVQSGSAILRRPIDVVAGFRAYLSVVGLPDLAPTAPQLMTASHPFASIETRLAALTVKTGRWAPRSAPPDANAATAVDLLEQESALVDLELTWFKGSGLTPLDWDGLAHATASRETRERAAWVLDQLSTNQRPSNLSTVLEDVARNGGQTLQQLLAEQSLDDDDPDPDDQRYAASLIGDVIAAALVEAARAHYVMNWAGPATLMGADHSVLDPWSAALAAVSEPSNAPDVLRWCIDLGASANFRAMPLGPHLGRTIMDADPVVLCCALLYTDWRARYVFVLDTGLIVMRPRFSDLMVGGTAGYTGDAGAAMLRRWAKSTGTELLSAKRAIYTDWTEIRSLVITTRSRGRFTVDLECVDGLSTKVRGDKRSRFDGNLAAPLDRFLGDRLILHEV